MRIFIYIYLFFYVTYVILGPHYITRLLFNDDLLIVKTIPELFARMIYISYIADLFNAYFFYNPNIRTWISAIIINILGLIGYAIYFYYKRNYYIYYYTGIIAHLLLIFPIIFGYFYYNLNISKISFKNKKFKKTLRNLFIFIIIYFTIEKNINLYYIK
tara:strand:+ start:61 stop:537 length:477 start_codon:yes stop_codon:yes gene_type:complete